MVRAVWFISRSVLIEAVRRKEVYVLVLASTLLIAAVMTVDFFEMEGLTKFYREFALKVMGVATALAVVVLAARQLPREFEKKTIYPLLARPISRSVFLAGKLFGVWLAAAFCLALFMVVFVGGMFHLGGTIRWPLFLQYVYLQMIMMLILATLCFLLSMVCNVDAAIAFGAIFYGMGAILTSMASYIYDYAGAAGQIVLKILNYTIPHLQLFDLSEKMVHSEIWGPLSARIVWMLTGYGLLFAGVYFSLSLVLFRRRAL